MEGIGLAFTATIVGAEIGTSIASVGATVSKLGTASGILIDAFNEDLESAIQSGVFFGIGKKLENTIKDLSGYENLEKSLLQQCSSLKMKLLEITTDTAIKNQQKKDNRKEEDEEYE